SYPPLPLTDTQVRDIIDSYCSRFHREHIEEAGCMVCGGLTKCIDLTPCAEMPSRMNRLLTRPGIAWRERLTDTDPHQSITGPIFAPDCSGVCLECKASIDNNIVPKFALANGLWLGEVPAVLSCLTYPERLLIARSRSSKCVVRVAVSGMTKMTGNMISYPNPFPALYDT
ncbi:hypothetical protein AURDEDRAFT_40954, partial [Auricularia subglabra TFB-10046 SS5]